MRLAKLFSVHATVIILILYYISVYIIYPEDPECRVIFSKELTVIVISNWWITILAVLKYLFAIIIAILYSKDLWRFIKQSLC